MNPSKKEGNPRLDMFKISAQFSSDKSECIKITNEKCRISELRAVVTIHKTWFLTGSFGTVPVGMPLSVRLGESGPLQDCRSRHVSLVFEHFVYSVCLATLNEIVKETNLGMRKDQCGHIIPSAGTTRSLDHYAKFIPIKTNGKALASYYDS